jgi:hypothetical protein
MTEKENLVETFRVGLKSNPPIKINRTEYEALVNLIDIRPRPAPALVLAMNRARERRLQDKLPK